MELTKTQKRSREYYQKNREARKAYARKYSIENPEKQNGYSKKYYKDNKSKVSIYMKGYRERNKEKMVVYFRQHYQENKTQIRIGRKIYWKKRRGIDIQFRLGDNLRGRLRKALGRNSKVGSAVRDLGCTIPELKFYLEGQFQDGMTWENYGLWHIDHKIPLTFFDLTERDQFFQAVHYTNLQPMWAGDNIRKGNKIIVD